MHTSKFPVLACAAAGIVSCFLPWTNSLVFGQIKSLTGLQYAEGYLTLICFALVAATTFLHGRFQSFSENLHKVLTVISIMAAGGTYYKILLLQKQAAKMISTGENMDHYVVYSPITGIYISAAAALGIALATMYNLILQYKMKYKPTIQNANWFDTAADTEVTGRYYLPS